MTTEEISTKNERNQRKPRHVSIPAHKPHFMTLNHPHTPSPAYFQIPLRAFQVCASNFASADLRLLAQHGVQDPGSSVPLVPPLTSLFLPLPPKGPHQCLELLPSSRQYLTGTELNAKWHCTVAASWFQSRPALVLAYVRYGLMSTVLHIFPWELSSTELRTSLEQCLPGKI